MTATVAKIGDAGAAFGYYSERDDYYLSDKSSAEWYGAGAEALGLRGDIDPRDFHAVLSGMAGDQRVGKEGFREVKQPDGSIKKVPQHTPGQDKTFSAPKGVSVGALVNKDERLTKAHDAAVRIALDYIQQHAIVTRQRDAEGGYVWRDTGSMVCGVVRHSTSRNLDPQLHSHCVIANMTRDPETGKWVSIDSRALYQVQREAGNVYMNALAEGARRAGYTVEWRVDERGNATFELAETSKAECDLFSSRSMEKKARLIEQGIDPAKASGAAREAAVLDTRSPKEHLPGSALHTRWESQARERGFNTEVRPEAKSAPRTEQRMQAARDAVAQGIASLSERKTRFTRREIMTEATTYAQGKATQKDLAAAIVEAHEAGTLIDRGTQVRGHSKELETVGGFTTKAAMETEAAMLRRAASIAERNPNLTLSGERIDVLIAAREQASGHAFTDEQRAATHAILEGRGSLAIVQGYAGTAKTTSVLATVADAAREAGVRVRAIAPTHSAADTLAAAIGAESQTVASLVSKPLGRDGRPEVWIVDESGMIAADDMKRLLDRADQAGAQVIPTGDTRQIGSVGAGSAFQQLQDAHPECVSVLTDIKRQTSAELKAAVYDSLQGNFSDALGKVDTQEIKVRDDAVAAIADKYMERAAEGKETLVVTLSRDDRADVNDAIQQRRMAAGEVARDLQAVTTLQSCDWTKAERRDASRYVPGMVIEAGRNFRRGPQSGEFARVTGVSGGKVTAVRANGEQWTFAPSRTKKFQVLDRAERRIGAGDRIVAKGSMTARDATDPESTIKIKNGTAMTVEGISQEAGTLITRLDDGRRIALDTSRGVKADLAYAETANQAQGRGEDGAIAWARSSQTNLADRQHMYVALSRAKQYVLVVTDSREKLAATLEKSAHGKETARLTRAEQQADATAGRQVDAADEKRPLTAWAKDLAGDMLARMQNAREDARIRARDRAQVRWAKRDRDWLARGERVGAKIDASAAHIERDIAKRFGIKMDRGALGRMFENKHQRKAREAIERVREGNQRAQGKINASLDRAFDRSVGREMRAGASSEEARQRVLERTLIDREFKFEKAIAAAGSVLNKGADAAADGVGRIWDRVQELRAGSENAAVSERESLAPTATEQRSATLPDANQAEPQQGREGDADHGPERDDGPELDMG